MNHKEFLQYHSDMCDKMKAICAKKNHDYSGGDNHAFRNFTIVEDMGIASAASGILVRMCDKMMRISNFVKSGVLKVSDESIEDTLLDLCNYGLLLAGYLKEQRQLATDDTVTVTVAKPSAKPRKAP